MRAQRRRQIHCQRQRCRESWKMRQGAQIAIPAGDIRVPVCRRGCRNRDGEKRNYDKQHDPTTNCAFARHPLFTIADHFGCGPSLVFFSSNGSGVSKLSTVSAENFRYSRNSTSFLERYLSCRSRISALRGNKKSVVPIFV